MKSPDILVIGAGIAGLACAVGIAPLARRLVVVEAAPQPGGRAASWCDAVTGDDVDIGPHIVLTEYRNMLRLLDMLDTRASIAWQRDKLITLLEDGRQTVMRVHRLPPPLHLLPSLAATCMISARDKLSNLPVVRLAMQLTDADIARLDETTALDLLRSLHVSPRFIDWFWKTAAMTLMNVPLERCSAGALMRVYAQIIGHNDYCIGFAATGLGELFVPRSLALIAQAGGEVRTHCQVERLLIEDGRCAGAITSNGETLRARHTILAVPPHEAARLVPDAMHAAWARFEPSPYISVYLWFDRKLTRERFWSRIWRDTDLNSDFYDLSNIRAGWQQRPSVIASNIIYSHRAAHLDDSTIIARTVAEIAEFAPAAALAAVVRASVHRIAMSIPCPYPGSESARPATQTDFPGLLLAGDWISTGFPASMESAVCAGFKAAEAVARSEGTTLDLALPPRPPEGLCRLYRRWRAREAGG